MKRALPILAIIIVIATIRFFSDRPEAPPPPPPKKPGKSDVRAEMIMQAKMMEKMVAPPSKGKGKSKTTSSGLKIEELKMGTGEAAKDGDHVSVHYTGWFVDNTKFDSSSDRGQPFEFTIGHGGAIEGWQQGIKGMKVGGKRRLTIPPELAYGAAGFAPTIPPNATLIFEVELVNVTK